MEDGAAESRAEAEATQTVVGEMKLSKKQQKKLQHSEYLREKKKQKNEDKKRKKTESAGKDENENKVKYAKMDGNHSKRLDDAEPKQFDTEKVSRAELKAMKDKEFSDKCDRNFGVVIDCSWESDHNFSSLKSLVQQTMYSYGYNRKHTHPAHLYVTGIGPLMKAQFNKLKYENWQCVHVQETEFLNEAGEFTPSRNNFPAAECEGGSLQNDLIYLTSDADETLDTIEPGKVYIIGGIVDRNSMKYATLQKAKRLNIRTAKLPIKENFALAATHILTVNHVFEIMLNYAACQNWTEAIKQVLPQRKEPIQLSSSEATPFIVTDTDVSDVAAAATTTDSSSSSSSATSLSSTTVLAVAAADGNRGTASDNVI